MSKKFKSRRIRIECDAPSAPWPIPMLEPITLHCPYCGEAFETQVDLSAGSQRYVEDCAICCRPIEVSLRVGDDDELIGVETHTDRE